MSTLDIAFGGPAIKLVIDLLLVFMCAVGCCGDNSPLVGFCACGLRDLLRCLVRFLSSFWFYLCKITGSCSLLLVSLNGNRRGKPFLDKN